ncbi:zinc-dependent peptidase [uncultured Deefgea sp.]|uniref:M90 family metallopeptidase n=1 Tax=uncultured Deefgea sp. TaxID=1304914 RepID=UPI002592CAA3|nr:M90 family metallopeptidase [uncultured Deefgea sp.]
MLNYFRRKRRDHWLAQHPIDDALWLPATTMPVLKNLSVSELARLRELAAWFLHTKVIQASEGIEFSDPMRVILAAQAVLPILNLGFEAYDDWQEIIIYPRPFYADHRHVDAIGVVHESAQLLAGQARGDGPVLFSWNDVMNGPHLDGWNVVIHELAHKLDMKNGGNANGYPALHAGMSEAAWQSAFTAAFADLSSKADAGEHSDIDLYAATNPAECFAVLSEVFFEAPQILQAHYPDVYTQMVLFYKQDTAQRLSPSPYRPISQYSEPSA